MDWFNSTWGYMDNIAQSAKGLFIPKVDYLLAIVLSISFGGVITFFETWVWHPYWTLIFLVIVKVFDVVTAIDLSIHRGGSFETAKLRKTVIDFTFLLIFLGLLHDLPLINKVYGLPQVHNSLVLFPKVIYIYVLLNQLASAAKNASLAGRIKGKFAEYVIKYVDRKKDIVEVIIKSEPE